MVLFVVVVRNDCPDVNVESRKTNNSKLMSREQLIFQFFISLGANLFRREELSRNSITSITLFNLSRFCTFELQIIVRFSKVRHERTPIDSTVII